jgi:hypothetical protein
MKLERRQMLQLSAAVAATPLLGACDGDGPVITLDTRFPIGPYGAQSTAETMTGDYLS